MSNVTWFVFRAGGAQAYGRPVDGGFLVRAGSTAVRLGTPLRKRDRDERDRLVRTGILVPDSDPALFRFSRDHLCSSSSQAGGVVKDGNCSGPQNWKNPVTNRNLKDELGGAE